MRDSNALLQMHLENMAYRHGSKISIEAGIVFRDVRATAEVRTLEPLIVHAQTISELSPLVRYHGWHLVARYLEAACAAAVEGRIGAVKPPAEWFDG